ncbi:WGR domain-containing protein [Ochrobactrum chromiisoli]|uniref:WGR domain-containing protein n=1 Tax=Ochrobactrum chromiisoli TaxID=2993941 RepID=A0ABT3QSU9_9HYPH|nr:WGR domain-containing protein [Ochrobactrum chromiisoli]MCX2698694.1 WGR domain-containing protein [Ochrobactrum chromiisoli]
MEQSRPTIVHLRRIDPSQNMSRFYSLEMQPTLFGEVSVIRHWGRIGSSGQTMHEPFDSQEDAARKFSHLRQVKIRKGYCRAEKKGSDYTA